MYISETQILYFVVTLTIVIAVVFGHLFYSNVRSHRRIIRLREEMDRARIEAIEKERELTAADLHDDIGTMLSGIKAMVCSLKMNSQRDMRIQEKCENYIDELIRRLRDIARRMIPLGLKRKGPLYAFQEFADLYSYSDDLRVTTHLAKCEGLTAEQSLHVFRILQEILHNTRKHALAEELIVSAFEENGSLVIETRDDGKGYDEACIEQRTGVGLQNILMRSKLAGAKLGIYPAIGVGTRYRIEFPLQH